MKSESFIFTNLHKPMTLFGVPPLLLILSTIIAMVVFVLLIVLQLIILSVPIAALCFLFMAFFFNRKTRKDHHFANTMFVPPTFWKGRKVRQLIAGTPPAQKGKDHVG